MDTALKQRLIGAVVLVALAVIFLPMLIKGPAPDSGVSDVPLTVPATPGGQYETRELPLVTPGNAPAGGVVGMDNDAPATTASEAVPLGSAPAGVASAMLPASTAGGNFAVNFGAYATPADADAVIARLKRSNLPAFREPATINGKTAYRVRIGPYAERADAETVRLQAAQVRSDVKAQVVTLDASATAPASTPAATIAAAPVTTQALPPDALPQASAKPVQAPAAETKPVATAPKPAVAAPKPAAVPAKPVEAPKPAASSVGFAVQLGAFSHAADANALRDKLRAGGFSAFVEQVKTDKGTLSRVRVGPVASRADADALKAQVAAKVGISGMVRPHP